MKNVIGLIALAGLATAATAQPVETQLKYEVRVFNAGNNDGWASHVDAAPGTQIEVRALISYTGTNTTVVALGQITFQPAVKNWGGDDVLATSGAGTMQIGPIGSNITTPPGYVPDAPGAYGRISPWASGTYTTSTFLRGHLHNNPTGDGSNYLRISRADVTNWFGVGATSGGLAINNTIGSGGVGINQGTIGAARPTNAPAAVLGTQNLVVFKFGFTLGASDTRPDLVVSTPANGIGRSTASATYGQPDTRWHQSENSGSPGTYRTDVAVVDATIHVTPTPASLALMGLGGLMVARRRR